MHVYKIESAYNTLKLINIENKTQKRCVSEF